SGWEPDRLQSAKGDKACRKTIDGDTRKATYDHTTKSLLESCGGDTFANVGSRKCYRCPSGWKHNPALTVGTDGVCYKPQRTVHNPATKQKTLTISCRDGFYDPIRGGSCWSCPSGYIRGAAAVDTDAACLKPGVPETRPAKFLSDRRFDATQLARGAVSLGCSNEDPHAFFDPKGGGACWRCPADHPARSLFPVDDPRACMSSACGAEGDRPCMVWERIPSCDKGLAEDFTQNVCRRPQNLACRSYVKTLAAVRTAIRTAGDAAGAAQEAALDKVPGKEAMMVALDTAFGEMQKQAERAGELLNMSELTDEFDDLVTENPEFMQRMIKALRIADHESAKIEAIFADADLICGGDVERIAWHLNNLGLGEVLDPPRTYGISVGQVQFAPARPFSLAAGLAGRPVLAALNLRDVVKPHHRMVFDVSASFPYSGMPGAGIELTATGSIGLQFATNFKDSHGLYFTHGLTIEGGLPSDSENVVDLAKHFGGVDLALGYQYRGATADECGAEGIYSWGIPVKLGTLLGIGFNTTCPYAFSGFTVPVQNFKKLQEIVNASTPAGATPTAVVTRHRWPSPEFKAGGGFEGAVTIVSSEKDARAGIF
ncbi:MAG: hypothetical protein PVF57_20985, partial [Pseudomonadales bacterium]